MGCGTSKGNDGGKPKPKSGSASKSKGGVMAKRPSLLDSLTGDQIGAAKVVQR